MELIDKYFRDKVDNVSFLELKDPFIFESRNIYIKEDIPLPIIVDEFIKGIKKGDLEEEINLSYIIEGIIYTIGIDNEFPYIDEYKIILLAYDENILDYILYQSIKDIEKEDYDNGAIKLRTLLYLNPNNINGLFNYGIAIEGIAKKYISREEEIGKEFLKYSIRQLEKILDKDKNFAPAYYKLGYHYKYFEQYLKANIMWQRFLPLSRDDLLIQEIREEIDLIEDDSNLEAGLTYLNYKDYDKALDYLLKLLPEHKKTWNINYFIGQAYNGSGQLDLALEFMNKALEYGDEPDIYNELGIIYFNMGDIKGAVDIFDKAIKNHKEDYRLYFNRGLSYIQLDEYMKAIEDIDKAYTLNPEDENIRIQKEILERTIYKEDI